MKKTFVVDTAAKIESNPNFADSTRAIVLGRHDDGTVLALNLSLTEAKPFLRADAPVATFPEGTRLRVEILGPPNGQQSLAIESAKPKTKRNR